MTSISPVVSPATRSRCCSCRRHRTALLAVTFAAFTTTAAAQSADFGDAPDNTDSPALEAYPGVVAHFPSLLATTNAAIAGRQGAHHLTVNEEWLAAVAIVTGGTTLEANAQLVDLDEDDASVQIHCLISPTPPPIFEPIPPICVLVIDSVHVDSAAAGESRFVNALVDIDRDGRWQSAAPFGSYPREHLIVNKELVLDDNQSRFVQSSPFVVLSPFPASLPLAMWVRVTVSRSPIPLPDVDLDGLPDDGWDGSVTAGGLAFGESEDHLVTPQPYSAKEPASHFSLKVFPGNPILIPAGGGLPPTTPAGVDVFRRQAVDATEVAATSYIVQLSRCMTLIGPPGIHINRAAAVGGPGLVLAQSGAIVNDQGVISVEVADPTPGSAPSTAAPKAVTNYDAGYPASGGPRFTRCWATLAIDPDGDVVEYDYPFKLELPVHFLSTDLADGDGDGVPDLGDRCSEADDPLRLEDLDGFVDDDGCRDADNDRDGVADDDDLCPLDREDLDGVVDDDGCPDPLFDGIFRDGFENGFDPWTAVRGGIAS